MLERRVNPDPSGKKDEPVRLEDKKYLKKNDALILSQAVENNALITIRQAVSGSMGIEF
jgi:hypothetical protein